MTSTSPNISNNSAQGGITGRLPTVSQYRRSTASYVYKLSKCGESSCGTIDAPRPLHDFSGCNEVAIDISPIASAETPIFSCLAYF
jgi:hypothetical protein